MTRLLVRGDVAAVEPALLLRVVVILLGAVVFVVGNELTARATRRCSTEVDERVFVALRRFAVLLSLPPASCHAHKMHAPMPRQSIFPGSTSSVLPDAISTSHLTSLQTCLDSLDHTVTVLSHTNGILSESVSDVPRLNTVLTSKRHFDVVSQSQVVEAKKQLEDEVRPHMKELLRRGEEEVERENASARRAKNKVRVWLAPRSLCIARHTQCLLIHLPLAQISQLTTRLEQVLAAQNFSLPSATQTQVTATTSPEEKRAVEEEHMKLADLHRVQRRRRQLEDELRVLEEELEREMRGG